MNKQRLYRKSKKIQGRGFFSDFISPIVEDKSKEFVREKLNEIFSKNKKHGTGLKFFIPK